MPVAFRGGYTRKVADACVMVPTVNPATVTPHTEAFQAVVWHLLVSHPSLQAEARDTVRHGAHRQALRRRRRPRRHAGAVPEPRDPRLHDEPHPDARGRDQRLPGVRPGDPGRDRCY